MNNDWTITYNNLTTFSFEVFYKNYLIINFSILFLFNTFFLYKKDQFSLVWGNRSVCALYRLIIILLMSFDLLMLVYIWIELNFLDLNNFSRLLFNYKCVMFFVFEIIVYTLEIICSVIRVLRVSPKKFI